MWSAILNNGLKVDESSQAWSGVKKDIKTLSCSFKGLEVILPPLNGKIREFVQWKSASASLSGGPIEVESQTVGIVLNDDTKILLKFNLKSNKIDVIVE